jgi:hypothetical protein
VRGEKMRCEVEVDFRKDFVKVEGNKIIIGLTSMPEKEWRI